MSAPEHTDDGETTRAADRELFERVGYLRSETDRAERTLAEMRERHQELVRQKDVVEVECKQLERELLQKLTAWRRLDEHTQTVEPLVQQFRAVTGSLTYRLTAALLRILNHVRNVVTFRWLRNS